MKVLHRSPVQKLNRYADCVAHRKPEQMLETIRAQVALAASLCPDVEFCAADASRAEIGFLCQAIETAVAAGAGSVSVCDTAGILLPDEFGAFLRTLYERIPALKNVFVKVVCDDALELAGASAVRALAEGASIVNCVYPDPVPAMLLLARKTGCGLVVPCRSAAAFHLPRLSLDG